MKRFSGVLWLLVLLTSLAATAGAVQADERILSFVSSVTVERDDRLIVTETIRVRAEGQQIKRGIFRDIPLTYEDPAGRTLQAGFELLSVQQDGEPAPHFYNRSNRGVRIYIGEEDVFLPPGVYTYTIRYETTRHIRFFPDHEEVYWNATGNEWAFPIDRATARIVLPDGVSATQWTAFTGRYGSTGRNYEVRSDDEKNEIVFTTTAALEPFEGLTVAVEVPAGSFEYPSFSRQATYFLSDQRVPLLGGLGLILVVLYYGAAWLLVGRDPQKGVVYPRFEIPDNLSPALVNYIDRRGFSDGGWQALAAACLSLAVKGRLRLEDKDGDLTLTPDAKRTGRNAAAWLPKGEAAIGRFLAKRGSPLPINKDTGVSVKTLGTKFRKAIEAENRGVFFKTNRRYLIPGIALSLLTIISLIAFGRLPPDQEGMIVVFLFFTIFFTVFAVNFGRAIWRLRSIALRTSLICVVFAIGMGFAWATTMGITGGTEAFPVLPALAIVLLGTNLLFFFLIGAPTTLGRKALDEIEGLRLYLTVAEKDRMNMADAPDMSVSHFEDLLPYAVALGVEKPWSEAFETWLSTAAASTASSVYQPGWYIGDRFDGRHISDSIGQTFGAMAGSFSSSLPAPKSSSSGFSSGGGFSGGGGGGGGGGGW